MTTLLVGFDSAWTPTNAGALVGALRSSNGSYTELGLPQVVNYPKARQVISEWQQDHNPKSSVVLLDQPTIVRNGRGQRPVESLVASPVSRRFGGVQPASTSRVKMFGPNAPVWGFLEQFGGAADPCAPVTDACVLETYPVLAMIALGWVLPHSVRSSGRLPKYNPVRRKTFSISDWRFVCQRIASEVEAHGLLHLSQSIAELGKADSPRKPDQDGLDACICLVVALYLVEQRECLMVGNTESGYIVVPSGSTLRDELRTRCGDTGRPHGDWVREFVLQAKS